MNKEENKNKNITERKAFSFSQQNLDVLDIINQQANASQYVCDAVRFFEENKDKIQSDSTQNTDISLTLINDIVDKRVKEILSTNGISIGEQEEYKVEPKIESIDESDSKKKDITPASMSIGGINPKVIAAIEQFKGK